MTLKFRHEWKHEINAADLIILRQRLRAVMRTDPHAADGKYRIRSLYFDNNEDKALREKLDGVNIREKFRIRLYNNDPSVIHLEKKSKRGGLGSKQSVSITAKETQRIISGDIDWMHDDERELLRELYQKMRAQGLKPRTIVDYTREPFIFPAGNVRVTLDYDIRTGLCCTDVLSPDCPTVPVPGNPAVLEVKWDEFLPDVIRDIVQLEGRRTGAFSKYAASRQYD